MKTTKKDFEIFCNECEYWINIFGLRDWAIDYCHRKMVDERARASWSLEAHSGTISLNTEWDMTDAADEKTENNIKRAAFHEVCHFLLGRLHSLAECRFISDHEIGIEIHRIIAILENSIWANTEG